MSKTRAKPTKWGKVTTRWVVSVLFAALVLAKLIYDYKTGNLDPLMFWMIVGSVSAVYLVIFIAILFPRTSKFLVGKRMYWRPFFAETPEEAEQHLRNTFEQSKKSVKRYLKVWIISLIFVVVLLIILFLFGLV